MNYNPTLQNCEWKKHYREIISKYNSSSPDRDHIDFYKEFVSKSRYAPLKSG